MAPIEPEDSFSSTDVSHLDHEWHARNAPRLPRRRFRWRKPVFVVTLILLNLAAGLFGGVTGFVALSSSDTGIAKEIRKRLNLTEDSELRVPVRQDFKLEESSAVIDSANKVSPAVVSVTASAQVVDFFGRSGEQEIGGGTGFILTSDGLIVTNKHVVSQQATYKVVLNDGRILDAVIKATDPYNDLAVLKVDATGLPTVELGSSDELQIGQYVIAVGNALGEFKNSVTLGVVSAKERHLDNVEGGTQSEDLTDLIQTDAAINPGNSGGPLVNMAGQVVGINTAIATPTGGSVGIGFAIPIDSVRTVIESVRKTGTIVRPYIGVRYAAVNKLLQTANNLPVDYGALVSRGNSAVELAVLPGSPADKAGIVEGDIILEVNGERIDESNPLSKRLQRYNVGDTVQLKLLRKGQEQTVSVTLEKLPN